MKWIYNEQTFLVDSIMLWVIAIRSLLFRVKKSFSNSLVSKLSVVLRLQKSYHKNV